MLDETNAHLKASGLSLAHQARNHWIAPVDNGTTIDVLLSDDFWMHVRDKFNRGSVPDKIEVYSHDNSLFAEILVIGKPSPGMPFVYRLISKVEAKEVNTAIDIDDGLFRIDFAGTSGWRVLKKQGRGYSELMANLPDSNSCRTWIDDYKKAQAA